MIEIKKTVSVDAVVTLSLNELAQMLREDKDIVTKVALLRAIFDGTSKDDFKRLALYGEEIGGIKGKCGKVDFLTFLQLMYEVKEKLGE
jgi:hypothetical protein